MKLKEVVIFELLNHKVVHSGYNKAQYLVYLFGQGLNSVEHYRGWTVVFSIPDHPQNNNTKRTLLIEAMISMIPKDDFTETTIFPQEGRETQVC